MAKYVYEMLGTFTNKVRLRIARYIYESMEDSETETKSGKKRLPGAAKKHGLLLKFDYIRAIRGAYRFEPHDTRRHMELEASFYPY